MVASPRPEPSRPPRLAPGAVGMGLRQPHEAQLLRQRPLVDWLEAHSENYFLPRPRQRLLALAQHYPISLHGVGLGLGSADPLDPAHLGQLQELVEQVQPVLVSEHLCWSHLGGHHFNDLLPQPLTEASLAHFSRQVERVQQALGRQLLIENPSHYCPLADSTLAEWDFLNRLAHNTGCGLLLDLNNIYVSAHNLGFDGADYLAGMHWPAVAELHLGGHTLKPVPQDPLLVDDHGSAVSEPVWALLRQARRHTSAPVLIEWDTRLPNLHTLLEQTHLARKWQTAA